MTTSIIQAEQTARKTERVLIRVYEQLLDEITHDVNYPNYPTDLQFKYERQVYDATRKAIETVHVKALEYVGATLGIETYFTTRDIELIKQETDAAVEAFFTSLRKGAELHQQVNANKEMDEILLLRLKGGSLLDPISGILASFTRNAISFITGAFARSVTSKTAQVADTLRRGVESLGMQYEPQIVRWTAQMDERTCEICRGLDGTEFDATDPSLPHPPEESHYSCRCYLEIV